MSSSPAMSIVMMAPDRFDTIERTFLCMRAQTIRSSLEIVIVTPGGDLPGFETAPTDGFHDVRVVDGPSVDSAPGARAAGVRAARAPVIGFTEDHSYPEPDWAERLLARFDEGFAAVGPAIENANPESPLSWANLLTDYGYWVARPAEDDAWHVPGHNGAYRRAALIAYGDRLEEALASESALQWELREKGERLCFEPRARTRHLNFTIWSTTARVHLDWGRCFAAHRVLEAGLARRALYVLTGPLIPLVRFVRIRRDLARARARGGVPRGVALRLLAVLAFDGVGEWIGYALGPGDSVRRLAPYEFHRDRHLSDADRQRFAAWTPAEPAAP